MSLCKLQGTIEINEAVTTGCRKYNRDRALNRQQWVFSLYARGTKLVTHFWCLAVHLIHFFQFQSLKGIFSIILIIINGYRMNMQCTSLEDAQDYKFFLSHLNLTYHWVNHLQNFGNTLDPNTIEGFWSSMRRHIKKIYAEFCLKFG